MSEHVEIISSDYVEITKSTNPSSYPDGFWGILNKARDIFNKRQEKEMYLYKTVEGYHMLPKYYTDVEGDCWKISDKGIFSIS